MDTQSSFAEAIRKTTDAYAQALTAVMNAVAAAPKPGDDAGRARTDQWLRLARMSKDSAVTALDHGFALWERECRRMLEAAAPTPPAPLTNPMELWAENWKKALDAVVPAGKPTDTWSEQARKQVEAVQQTLQESVAAWQRLWQASSRTR